MEELTKKIGGAINTFIVLIVLAFGISQCRKCSQEHDEKTRQELAKAAIEDAAWKKERFREFKLGPGEEAEVYAGHRRFEFHNSGGPIMAVAKVGSVERTAWEEFPPQVRKYFADPDDCEKILFRNDGKNTVTVQFMLLSRD